MTTPSDGAEAGSATGVTLVLVTTLGDQMAFLDHALRAPDLRRARRIREALFMALTPVGLLIGGAVAWLSDRHPAPLASIVQDLATTDRPLMIGTILVAVAIMAVCLGLSRISQRAQRRRLLKKILRARTDVDRADPELRQRTEATFGPDGIESRTDAGSSLVRWHAVQRLDETEHHLFFVSGPFGGFIVPKREIRPDEAERLREIARRWLPASPALG